MPPWGARGVRLHIGWVDPSTHNRSRETDCTSELLLRNHVTRDGSKNADERPAAESVGDVLVTVICYGRLNYPPEEYRDHDRGCERVNKGWNGRIDGCLCTIPVHRLHLGQGAAR